MYLVGVVKRTDCPGKIGIRPLEKMPSIGEEREMDSTH